MKVPVIELTKDHKERLIEICEYMFPEYYKIEMVPDGEYIRFFKDKNSKVVDFDIHWFEACMTIIPISFSEVEGDWHYYLNWLNYHMTRKQMLHPVDYYHAVFLEDIKQDDGFIPNSEAKAHKAE
jgi:hypothetical protein